MSNWLNKKRLFQIHGWLGLNLGALLFVICFSGTWAVFGPELDQLANPMRRVAPPQDDATRLSWGELHQRLTEAYPHAMVLGISAPTSGYAAAEASIAYGGNDLRHAYINPYTGEVQGQAAVVNIQSFLRIFHKQFYIVPNRILPHGLVIVAPFGVLLAFSAVTGLLIYKQWWRALVQLRMNRSRRIFWSDLHRMAGVWTLLITVVFGITGAWYLVERLSYDFDIELEPPAPQVAEAQLAGRPAVLEAEALDTSIASAREAYPELAIDLVWFPSRPGDPLLVQGQADTWFVRGRANQVYVDPYSAEVIKVVRGTELPPLQRLAHTADPFHFGTFGGLATRVLWFIAGLVLCVSILVGAYIWWLRVSRPGKPFFKKSPWCTAASATFVFAVLGSAVYSGLEYTGRFLKASPATEQPIPVATASVDEWKMTAFRHGPAEQSAPQFSVRPEPGHQLNVRSAKMWLGSAAAEERAVEARLYTDRIVSPALSPPAEGRAAAAKVLHVSFTDHRGERHVASFDLEAPPDDVQPAWRAELPEAPGVSRGAAWGIGLFIVLTALPVVLWLALVR